MKYMTNLKDLLIKQLRELYDAEHEQHAVLSGMVERVSSHQLKKALELHIHDTERHIRRLEDIFGKLQTLALGEASEAMQANVKEAYDLIERSGDPAILDAALIAAIQYIEHFEIAGYGTACTFANELALPYITKQLHLTLKEEKKFDEQLSEIAMSMVNRKARAPVVV